MIKHIVMFALKDFAEGAPKEENARKVKEQLEALKDKIPGLRALEVGININPSPAAADVVLYAEFDNLDALENYQHHPEHLKAGDFIGKVRLTRTVVDYET